MKITCPKCGRTIGDTMTSLDATINCKRCGAQKIHIRTANFNDYLKVKTTTEESND
jgi:DNA-directed RNA polymerase subunit RPC12/RpoP